MRKKADAVKQVDLDDVVRSAMAKVNWDVTTRVEAAAFGTSVGMVRDAEVSLRLYDAIFELRGRTTIAMVMWSTGAVAFAIPTWIAVAFPATVMLFDAIKQHSKRIVVHGALAQYRDDLLKELRSLSEKYPAKQNEVQGGGSGSV